MRLLYKENEEEKELAIIDETIRPLMVINDDFSNFEDMMNYFIEHGDAIKIYDDLDINIFDYNSLRKFLIADNNKNKLIKLPLNEISKTVIDEPLNTLNYVADNYYEDIDGFIWVDI